MAEVLEMISLIVAHGKNREIGLNNDLLWNLPTDLMRFKEFTTGHTVVMGRKTFESIGRPLPNRDNIVLSTNPRWIFGLDVKRAYSIEPILRESMDKEIFIIGGEQVYKAFLPYADRLYITLVEGTFKADTYFPEYFDLLYQYEVIDYQHIQKDEKNPYDTRFVVYEKRN